MRIPPSDQPPRPVTSTWAPFARATWIGSLPAVDQLGRVVGLVLDVRGVVLQRVDDGEVALVDLQMLDLACRVAELTNVLSRCSWSWWSCPEGRTSGRATRAAPR